jgi:hypothetical protein
MGGSGSRRHAFAALLCISFAGAPAQAQFHEFTQAGFQVQRLAMEGAPAPAMPAGVTLTAVGSVRDLDYFGEGVALWGALRGPGVVPGVNDVVMYSLRAGQLVPIVRSGDPAPGLEPATFAGSYTPWSVNSRGDVAFQWYDTPPGRPSYWVARPTPQLLSMYGVPAPGTDGLVFKTQAHYLRLSESGHVAFMGEVGPVGSQAYSSGIWTDRGGALARVYSDLRLGGAMVYGITPDDRLTFTTGLTGLGVTSANNTALFREQGGQLKLLLREGDPAPGLATGEYILDLDDHASLRVRTDGRVAMVNGIRGPNVLPNANSGGVWSEASGELRLVMRSDDPAPAAGEGMRFGFPENVAPAFNNRGQTVFKSGIRGPGPSGDPTGFGVWLDDNGSKGLLARLGDHAPGFAPDTYFVSFQDYALGINDFGDIVLQAQVYGSDAPRAPVALWFWHQGVPQLFIQQDAYFDAQLVSGFIASDPDSLGRVLLYVDFAGPDGIQDTYDDVSAFYLVTIPEPATLALLASGAMATMRRRRR